MKGEAGVAMEALGLVQPGLDRASDFILFRSRNGTRYLYDAATNTVHPWPYPLEANDVSTLYGIASEELGVFEPLRPLTEVLNYVSIWRETTGGFRSYPSPARAALPVVSAAPPEKRGPTLFSDLVLINTEACNQRCRYCSFSGNYPSYRHHGSAVLEWNMAKDAVDYFLALNRDGLFRGIPGRNINIFFYGGEPLLNFDLIHRVFPYAASRSDHHYTLSFGVSTNLTLLTPTMLSFFREHNAFLSVSLDGPREDHDLHRRFVNGKPTFDRVMRKLAMIQRFDEQYYFKRVKLVATLTGHSDLLRIHRFFEQHGKELPQLLMVNYIKDLEHGCFHRRYPYDEKGFGGQLSLLLQTYLKAKEEGRRFRNGEFLYRLTEEPLSNIYNRVHSLGDSQKAWYTGTCFPGRKLALAPNGHYYTCERVNYHYPIGRIDRGLDPALIEKLLSTYNECLPDCNRCWARNLCTICFAAVIGKKDFSFQTQCQLTRIDMAARLILLYTMLEQNPSALSTDDSVWDRQGGLKGC